MSIIMTISVENYIHVEGHVCLWKRLIKGNYFHEKPQQVNLDCCLSHPQTGERRTVSHINYITWPDHGVPKVGSHCTNFVSKE